MQDVELIKSTVHLIPEIIIGKNNMRDIERQRERKGDMDRESKPMTVQSH